MSIFPLDFGATPALIDSDSGIELSYSALKCRATQMASCLVTARALIFLFTSNQLPEVVFYLGALNAGHVVCLLDTHLHPTFKTQLVARYRPHYIITAATAAYSWEGLYRCQGTL